MSDVGLVWSPEFLKHLTEGDHPECPERLIPFSEVYSGAPWGPSLKVLPPRPLLDIEARRCHAEEMLQRLEQARGDQGWFDPDTYYGPHSISVAQRAAGATVDLALAVFRGSLRRGLSVVRPPGHHATPSKVMGFCLLNNVALAAAALLSENPQSRLAILDFDLHHGNGTQDAFYTDPRVLFVSSHRFPYYPGTGALGERGQGRGLGATLNFPLPEALDGPFFYRLWVESIFPHVAAFRPDMILVSAGYDGHVRDPMGGLRVDTAHYLKLVEALVALGERFGGKILFCLEGGYHPQALGECLMGTLERLVELPRQEFAPCAAAGSTEGEQFLERFETHFRHN